MLFVSFSPHRAAARVRALAAVAVLALTLLAAANALLAQMFFEGSDRQRLHAHLRQVREALAASDSAAALALLPERLEHRFAALPDVTLRVQGAYGQPLYEQGTTVPQVVLARAATTPAPLQQWVDAEERRWRGQAVLMRAPLDGAAPLAVVVALDVQRQWAFALRLHAALGVYVLLVCGALAWLARRVLAALVPPQHSGAVLSDVYIPQMTKY